MSHLVVTDRHVFQTDNLDEITHLHDHDHDDPKH